MLNVTARQDLMSKIVDTLLVVVEDARFDFDGGLQARVGPITRCNDSNDIDAAAFDTWELMRPRFV